MAADLLERYHKVPAKKRYGAMVALLLSLGAAHYYFITTKQERSRANRELELIELNKQRTEKETRVTDLKQFEARLNDLKDNLSAARAQLPDDADIPFLILQIGQVARASGLTGLKLTPKGEVTQGFYAEIAFEMGVMGSYHEIATFIDSVGHLDRIMNVTGIKMSGPKEKDDKVVLASDFTLKTYRFVEGVQ